MRWGIPRPAIHLAAVSFSRSQYKERLLETAARLAETRCSSSATSFCEYAENPNKKEKKKIPTWFALSDKRQLFFFAGVWKQWEGTRGTKAEPVKGKHLIYAFLTPESNKGRCAGSRQGDAGHAHEKGRMEGLVEAPMGLELCNAPCSTRCSRSWLSVERRRIRAISLYPLQ